MFVASHSGLKDDSGERKAGPSQRKMRRVPFVCAQGKRDDGGVRELGCHRSAGNDPAIFARLARGEWDFYCAEEAFCYWREFGETGS
jgi:hypothetical protein